MLRWHLCLPLSSSTLVRISVSWWAINNAPASHLKCAILSPSTLYSLRSRKQEPMRQTPVPHSPGRFYAQKHAPQIIRGRASYGLSPKPISSPRISSRTATVLFPISGRERTPSIREHSNFGPKRTYWKPACSSISVVLRACPSNAEIPLVCFILFKIVSSSSGDESKKKYIA